jgi:hypothetical protein
MDARRRPDFRRNDRRAVVEGLQRGLH